MQLTIAEFDFLAICLEGFLFGVYSGIFALYLLLKQSTSNGEKQSIVFYALCVLFVLSVVVFALDVTTSWFGTFGSEEADINVMFRLDAIAQPALFGCCDFIAQSILVHRCWFVWGRNIRVVIIPSILAFAYFVLWTTALGGNYFAQGTLFSTFWGYVLVLTSLTASMTVNALATGLIVFKIFKVFRQAKNNTTSNEKLLNITGGSKLLSIIFVIIESGMVLFAVQLVRLVLSVVNVSTAAGMDAFDCITGIHDMINGITPTIILVRVSMGLSFQDETSTTGAISSLRFNDSDFPDIGSTNPEIPEIIDICKERISMRSGTVRR